MTPVEHAMQLLDTDDEATAVVLYELYHAGLNEGAALLLDDEAERWPCGSLGRRWRSDTAAMIREWRWP